jgi:hypothetical protein
MVFSQEDKGIYFETKGIAESSISSSVFEKNRKKLYNRLPGTIDAPNFLLRVPPVSGNCFDFFHQFR